MKERLQADTELIKLVNLLLGGETLTVARIRKELGLELAAARRKFKVLARLRDVSVGNDGPAKTLRMATLFTAPHRVNNTEVCALALASSVASTLHVVPLAGALRRLTQQIVASSREFSQAKHLDRKFWVVRRGGDMAVQDLEGETRLLTVIGAILGEKRLTLEYEHGSGDGASSRVEIRPVTLAYHDQQFYVVGRRNDGSFYPYRLSRTKKVTERGPFAFPSQAEYDPAQLFRDAFGIFVSSTQPVEKVVVRLREPYWVRYAQQHRWHESQTVVRRDDGSVDVVLSVRICKELERWVLWFGADAEVIEPSSLREFVRTQATAVGLLYGSKAVPPSSAFAAAKRRPAKTVDSAARSQRKPVRTA